MAAGLIEKHVDGEMYEFQQFGAEQSIIMFTRLFKIVGEPLGIVFGNTMSGTTGKDIKLKDVLDKEIDWASVMPAAVKALLEKLHEQEVLAIIKDLTEKYAMCNGKRINFNEHYKGRVLTHLPKVLWAALEVQYGNFSGGRSAQASPDTAGPIPFQSIQAR